MTLGQAPEALAIGYLRNQRLARSIEEIAAVQVDWETDSVVVTTRKGIKGLADKMKKRTVDHRLRPGHGVRRPDGGGRSDRLRDDVRLREDTLYALLDLVRMHETIYKRPARCTAARWRRTSAGAPRSSRSSRTSAATTRSTRSPARCGSTASTASDKIFYTTGRLTSEMVIKAAQMRIPFLVSRSGLTQMGCEIAEKVGITMIGRAVNRHYLLFTGEHRFVKTTMPTMMA